MAFDDYLGAERQRMQAQAPQAPAYMFRDDRNAQNANNTAVQTAQIKANPFGAAPASSGPFAPAKPGAGFDAFSKDLEAGGTAKASGSNPFAPTDAGGSVSGAISRLLSNPSGGYDASASLAREGAIKKDQQANEDMRSQAALQFLPGTGQSIAPAQQQTDQQRLAMRDFDLQAAAGHSNAEQQGLQTGASLGLQQSGQRLSAEQAAANLAETQRQFNEHLPIEAATAKSQADIAAGQLALGHQQLDLNKTLGLGDLSVKEKSLAQSASQFADQLSFQKAALAQGATEAEAQRAWQAAQNTQSQNFQASENALGRTQQQQQFNDTFGLSKDQQAFNQQIGLENLSLEKQKVANQASQFSSQEEFQKYALEKNLSADEAKLAWQSNENNAQRLWQTGQQLSSEQFQTLINKSNQDFTAAQDQLKATLQLTVQGNDQKFQAAQTAAAQAYDAAKTDKSMSHEDALAASQQVFQKELQAAGFTNEQIMQATQLTQQANLAKQQMDLQETMHMADLAQSDKQFGQKLGLDYEQMGRQTAQFNATLKEKSAEFAQQFGLDQKQVESALASTDFQNQMAKIQIGMELTKNNPDAMAPFAQQLATTMGKALGLSDAQIAAGIKSGALTGGSSSTGTAQSQAADFSTIVNKTGAFASPEAQDAFTTQALNLKNVGAKLDPDKIGGVPDSHETTTILEAAANRLKALGVDPAKYYDMTKAGDSFGGTHTIYDANQKGLDYAIYDNMTSKGMNAADAEKALTALIGKDRAQAALSIDPTWINSQKVAPMDLSGLAGIKF